jgi:Ca2+-binding RTX toxin-like protein
VTINLQLNLGVDDGGSYDTYTSIENAIGSVYDDVIVGQAGIANRLEGGDGNDTFVGEGVDTVIGGEGIDIFFGGQGAALNLNLADQGIEQVWGSYVGDVMDGTTSSANLVLVGQGLTGGANSDTMLGGAGDDFVYYRAGDVISGGGGNDWAVATLSEIGVQMNLASTGFENAWGSTFDDLFDASASASTVVLVGDAGNDTLLGGSAADFIYGQSGDDLIDGGAGGDVLVGGEGADTFVYESLAESGLDSIFDFESGIDRLQLTAESFGLSAGANLTDGTSFISGNDPSVGLYAGPTFLYDTTSGMLSYDADGSGSGEAEAIILLAYQPNLIATDFFFV